MTQGKTNSHQEPTDGIRWGVIIGLLAAAAAGALSEGFRGALNEDPTILLAIVGSAVGLLAVTVAVVTLLLTLRAGVYADIIAAAGEEDDDEGIKRFLAPFRQVAILSAAATVVALIGLLFGPSQGFPNGTGPEPLEVAVFSIAVLLFVEAVVATIRLISIVQKHAIFAARSERTKEDLEAAREDNAETNHADGDDGKGAAGGNNGEGAPS